MFYLKTLKLNNFRCYDVLKTSFTKGINIIYGPNACGKTSIVEAISYLGLCKSFKNAKDEDLLKLGKDYFYITGEYVDDNLSDNVVISLMNKTKTIKKNSISINKLSEYIGFVNVVTFIPDDLDIIKGSPSERRRFLNINISQSNKQYINALSKYNKILKMRNEYLKSAVKIDQIYLDALTTALIIEGKTIISVRNSFINALNPFVNECAERLSSNFEKVNIQYKPNIDCESYEKEMKDKIKADIQYKTTTIGPHKDDFKVYINNNEASIYGSQGQIRSSVISLKLGLSKYLKNINNKQIIILDDVFSELDDSRQDKLLEVLDNDSQIFITTTSVETINKQILENSNLIKVRKED